VAITRPDPRRFHAMTTIETAPITLRSSSDLIASVPYLLGFHPSKSVVVVAMADGRVLFAARSDLAGAVPAADITRRLISVLLRDDADTVAIVGYGTGPQVLPLIDSLRNALAFTGIHVLDVLRVEGGRYWSLMCVNPACCPPEGKLYEPATSTIGAAAVYAGHLALPDREAVARSIAPVQGEARAAMAAATIRADARMARLVERARAEPDTVTPLSVAGAAGSAVRANARVTRAIRAAGEEAVDCATDRYRAGRTLADDEVAWLSVLLVHLPVRDRAWEQTTDDDWQLDLWADVTRRVQPPLVAAPASLLAFAAWRVGNGALANLAVERALAAEPDYALARLLDEILVQCLPPSIMVEARVPPHQRNGSAGHRAARGRPTGDLGDLERAS